MTGGNFCRSMRLIQSHSEPRLEFNLLLPHDPIESPVKYVFFFPISDCSLCQQYVKHICRRSRGQSKKRGCCPWADVNVFSMRWGHTLDKKKENPKPAATVCRHYRLGDNTRTFCFALPAFPNSSKRTNQERENKRQFQRWTGLRCAAQQPSK